MIHDLRASLIVPTVLLFYTARLTLCLQCFICTLQHEEDVYPESHDAILTIMSKSCHFVEHSTARIAQFGNSSTPQTPTSTPLFSPDAHSRMSPPLYFPATGIGKRINGFGSEATKCEV